MPMECSGPARLAQCLLAEFGRENDLKEGASTEPEVHWKRVRQDDEPCYLHRRSPARSIARDWLLDTVRVRPRRGV